MQTVKTVFAKTLLSAAAILLTACTTRDERIGLYRNYCAKVGYAPNSEGLHDCIVQLETHRSTHAHYRH